MLVPTVVPQVSDPLAPPTLTVIAAAPGREAASRLAPKLELAGAGGGQAACEGDGRRTIAFQHAAVKDKVAGIIQSSRIVGLQSTDEDGRGAAVRYCRGERQGSAPSS